MKRPVYIHISIISMVLFLLEVNSIFSIGKIINYFFVCEQNPVNSFPCFAIYDIYFIIVLIPIFIISLLLFFIHKKK